MHSRKKILVVARWPVGGIRTYFRYVYSQDVFDRYHFTFLMPDSGEIRDFLEAHCPELKFDFINSGNSVWSFYKHLNQELKTKRYSLLHSHGFTAGLVSGLPFILSHKPKHLMTAHDVFVEKQFESGKGRLMRFGMSLVFRNIDKIHAVSHDCKDNFLKFFPTTKPRKIKTILHGVDTEYFYNATPRDFLGELNLQDVFLIGFFGRFMAQKGFRDLVAAVQSLIEQDPDLKDRVRVLTFGWGGFVREEFEAIECLGLDEVFVQMAHTDDMAAALKGVDLVVMPSLWEACGLLGMEALVCGAPIVGTNCIGLREVLEGSPAEIVEPRSYKQLAHAILKNLKFSSDLKPNFKAYAAEARDRFALLPPATQLEDLYCSMIKDK
jgi:glycosyltransferase involved in cell wall biosynthesis